MSKPTEKELECINTVRCLAVDMVVGANSGHPGMPMACAPQAYLLWNEFMNYNPQNPKWFNRDRFVLSNGHGCALLYSMLHLTGYPVTLDDLKAFRSLGSITPGHPENFMTPGVEATTGPLGQGISNAVGMAIAEAHLAATFNKPDNKIIDNNIYVFCGDGCLQEGVASEACSLAGHLKLGKLVVLYDDNKITIDGRTDLAFTEDVLKRFESYGWHTQKVKDGDNDMGAMRRAITNAKKDPRPSIIAVNTTIGYGAEKAGQNVMHSLSHGSFNVEYIKKSYNFPTDKTFVVPDVAYEVYGANKKTGAEKEAAWNAQLEKYCSKYPTEGAQLKRQIAGELPQGWKAKLPSFSPSDKGLASRQYSQKVLEAIFPEVPELMGGSADLTASNLCYVKDSPDFQKDSPQGRNVRWGVREHGMAACMNGIAYYGGLIPFGASFMNFMGYAMGAARLSAVSRLHTLYIMTHDSIGLGEDGPTHQPVEMLSNLRSIPNMLVIRPCDGNETSGAYAAALEFKNGPTVLSLSRHALPNQEGSSAEKVAKGAYTLKDCSGTPDIIIVSTGSEVCLCTDAAKKLSDLKVRVVSMPSWELFDEQDAEYKKSVFIPGVPVMSVEAAATFGWHKYAHETYGLDSFGASAPPAKVFEKFGFTADAIAAKAKDVATHYKKSNAYNLNDRSIKKRKLMTLNGDLSH